MAISLLDLPREILIDITQDLTVPELLALARICKALSHTATAHLYRQVYYAELVDVGSRKDGNEIPHEHPGTARNFSFGDTRIFDIARFEETIRKWPDIRDYIQAASFSWASPQETPVHDTMLKILSCFGSSQTYIHLSPPYLVPLAASAAAPPPWVPLDLEQLFLPSLLGQNFPLASLEIQAAHLCPTDSKGQSTGAAIYQLFKLPTLRRVKIDCAPPHPPSLFPCEHRPELANTSRVTHLTITDYHKSAEDLTEILTWPIGLVFFRLSLVTNQTKSNNVGTTAPLALKDSLRPQQKTLVSLDISYLDYTPGGSSPVGKYDGEFSDLRGFTRLESLAIPYEFFIHGELQAYEDPRTKSQTKKWKRKFGSRVCWEDPGFPPRGNPIWSSKAARDILDHFPPNVKHVQIQTCSRHTYFIQGQGAYKRKSRDAYRLRTLFTELPVIKTMVLPRLESVKLWEPCAMLKMLDQPVGMLHWGEEIGETPGLRDAGIEVTVTMHDQSPMSLNRRKDLEGPPLLSKSNPRKPRNKHRARRH